MCFWLVLVLGFGTPMQLVGSVFLASCVLWVTVVLSHVLQVDSLNPPFRPTLSLHSFWSAVAAAAVAAAAVAAVAAAAVAAAAVAAAAVAFAAAVWGIAGRFRCLLLSLAAAGCLCLSLCLFLSLTGCPSLCLVPLLVSLSLSRMFLCIPVSASAHIVLFPSVTLSLSLFLYVSFLCLSCGLSSQPAVSPCVYRSPGVSMCLSPPYPDLFLFILEPLCLLRLHSFPASFGLAVCLPLGVSVYLSPPPVWKCLLVSVSLCLPVSISGRL